MLKETIAVVILSIYASTCSAFCITQPITGGGITVTDINDPEVIAAAYNAHNIAWDDASYFKILAYNILSAKSQIVSGIKYYLKIEYPQQRLFCDFEVIHQSWINQYSLVFQSCIYEDSLPTVANTLTSTTITMESN
jgi:hypothetical protein